MVSAEKVCKRFGDRIVLRGVDLVVDKGQVACLLGPSGSGKSTLLRCMNGLETIDAGRLRVDGELVGFKERGEDLEALDDKTLSRQRTHSGMVFQTFNLFPHMSALDNVTLGPVRVLGEPRKSAETRARELLAAVGLAGREGSFPRQMSGGQQQRVAIARALAMKPKLMLFDEPTSALDPELVGEVLGVMKELADEGMTMVVVTHEIAFAREAADVVAVLSDGRIIERGTPDDVILRPTHPKTRDFLRRVGN